MAMLAGLTPVTGSAGADSVSALFVTGNAAKLPGGDANPVAELEALGYAVNIVDDDAVDVSDADAVNLVVISTSISPSKVGSMFRDVAVPVLTWERFLYANLGMTAAGSSRGEISGQRTLNIVAPDHPIAAGFSGPTTVQNSSAKFTYGVPGSEATVVATAAANSVRATIFAYETASSMVGLSAPARRVGFYASFATPRTWNESGASLFRAAVIWAADPGAAVNRPPTVEAGSDQEVGIGATISLGGEVADDGLPEVPGALTTTWSGPASVTFDDATDPNSIATFDQLGTHELTLTATDGELTTSETVLITVVDPSAIKRALFIASTVPPPSVERPAAERLEELGFEVIYGNDNTVGPSDAATASLVVIGSSVSPSALDPAIADLALPVMIWERRLYTAFGFVSPGGGSGEVSGRSIRLQDVDHPTMAGLTGLVNVYTGNDRLSWTRPEGDVTILAAAANSASKSTMFSYDAGAMMAGTTAPAKRLGFFAAYRGPSKFNSDGWAMFDASVAWLTAAAPTNQEPVVDVGPDITHTEGATLSLTPPVVTDDGLPDPPAVLSATWSGPAGVTFNAVDTPSTQVTFDGPGTYVLRLTVDDGEHSAFDELQVTVASNTLVAAATSDVNSGPTPLTVNFDGTNSTGVVGVADYAWDFGDGATGSGSTTSHTYDQRGVFEAELTVTANGAAATDSITIRVGQPSDERISDGLVVLYDFAESPGSSVVEDRSGFGAALDLTAVDPTAIEWLSGGGLRLNGPTPIVSSGPATKVREALTTSGELTVEAWVDPALAEPPEPGRLLTVSPDDSIRNLAVSQGFVGDGGSRIELRLVSDDSTEQGYPAAETAPGTLDGELVHVVATRDAQGRQRIWLDGELTDEAIVGGELSGWDPTYPLAIGADPDGLRPWLGDFHLVAVYDRALSRDEVCWNLAAGPGRAVSVGNIPPTACLSPSVTTGAGPLNIEFDGSGSGDAEGLLASYSWDFGDGTGATGPAVTHTYDDGDYVATLTVADQDGATATTSIPIVVRPEPVFVPRPAGFDQALGFRASGGFFDVEPFLLAEEWIGSPIYLTTQFLEKNGPFAMASNAATLMTAGNGLPEVADRVDLSIAVPLGFGNANARTAAGRAQIAANLQAVAAGNHDDHYNDVAQALVDGGHADAVLRLGHEFSGQWAPWSSRENEADFIAAWRHVHDLFEAVSPAFRFDWNSIRGQWVDHGPPSYPGDDYVDIISIDIYWRVDPDGDSWSQSRWQTDFESIMVSHRDFAIAHGKPLAYPEWGLIGGDEPRFIEHMYNWMASLPATGPGSLDFQAYFNSGSSREELADHPASRQAFIDLFGNSTG
jgi:PKD repeat protein